MNHGVIILSEQSSLSQVLINETWILDIDHFLKLMEGLEETDYCHARMIKYTMLEFDGHSIYLIAFLPPKGKCDIYV